MFDYIKQTYKIGDAVKIKCSEGIYSGRIVFMSDNSIAIVDKNGQKHVVGGSDLIFCEHYKEESAPSEFNFDEFKKTENKVAGDIAHEYKTEDSVDAEMPKSQKETVTNERKTPKWGKKLICSAILVVVALIVFIGRDWIMGNYKDGHEYVDLGLPSGVKWATYNVGATKPTEYGDYFAWGETKPKEVYGWDTYKWTTDGCKTFTKYVASSNYGTVDNKTVLDAEDDAATANWGRGWRMPTRAEQDELREGCDWEREEDFNGSGVNGWLGTSKANGNTIFLPAAGRRGVTGLYNVGDDGDYWSSSLFENYSGWAYGLFFYDGNFDWIHNHRLSGQSVRAVCEK